MIQPAKRYGNPLANINHPEEQTDLANARRFIDLHGDKVLFCYEWKKWLRWTGRRWEVDKSGAIMRLAKDVADAVWREAGDVGGKDAQLFAVRTAGKTGIQAMISLAESERPISVDEMDSNPWLLNCSNGTLDLLTGELKPHRQEDCITKLCPTPYHPDAKAPTWEQFQQDVSGGDADLIPFKQRLFGYGITADVREQIIAILYGVGSNGKSTEIATIADTIGDDYSGTLPRSLLMESRSDRHPTELTTLFGRRLMIAHETDAGGRLSEGLVKQLTGSDAITARGMQQDFWTFSPTHKIILLTNHKPDVKGTNHAIWRRIRLIPYNVRFDGDQRDKSMPEKLAAEKAGILAWLVRGCLEWQRIGLGETESVNIATADYRQSQDSISQFITECCVEGEACKAKARNLHDAFQDWGGGRISMRRFGEAMTERGYERKTSNGTWYHGIGLRSEVEYGF